MVNSELSAQSIAINGIAFTGDNKEAFPVACASICFYDYLDQSKLDFEGNFMLHFAMKTDGKAGLNPSCKIVGLPNISIKKS